MNGWGVFIIFFIILLLFLFMIILILISRSETAGACCTSGSGCQNNITQNACVLGLQGIYLGDNSICTSSSCLMGACEEQQACINTVKSLCPLSSTFQVGKKCTRTGFLVGDVIRLFNNDTDSAGYLSYCGNSFDWCQSASQQYCRTGNQTTGTLCPGYNLAITNPEAGDQWIVDFPVGSTDPTVILLRNAGIGSYLGVTSCQFTGDAPISGSYDGYFMTVNQIDRTKAQQFKVKFLDNPNVESPRITIEDLVTEPNVVRNVSARKDILTELNIPLPCNITNVAPVFSANNLPPQIWTVTFINRS